MEEYLKLKKECCEEQKKNWEKIVSSDIRDYDLLRKIKKKINSEKSEMFSYYMKLNKSLSNVPDTNFVNIERSKMFEKMVELAEFNDGTDLGMHYFQVRRGPIATQPTAFVMAVMGPGEIEQSNLLEEFSLESSLKKVQLLYFGEKVTGILEEACTFMENLTNVYFHPDSKCSIIDVHAFQSCLNLKEIKIPDKVTILGESCFADCESLSEITLGKNVEKIFQYVFMNCTHLGKIHIPDSVKLIGDGCFLINTQVGYEGGLQYITGMKNLEELGVDVFTGTDIEIFAGGPKLKKIGETCFLGTPLETLTLEYNKDLEIGDGAFESLDELKIINLKGGTPKKWVEKLKGQFFKCYEIDNLTESYKEQIQKIRERNSYDDTLKDNIIYVAYARILEQEAMQLVKGGSTNIQIPQDISRYLITEGFSPK